MTLRSEGRLEAKLRAGAFVLTAETSPPDAASADAVMAKVGAYRGRVDAVNVTDGAGARAHMSALATAAIMAQNGIEPILQFTVRDRNRLALEGDLIGGHLGRSNSAQHSRGDKAFERLENWRWRR